MTKLPISIGLLAAIFSLSANAQTMQVTTLDQAGAESVLQAAKETARKRNAPSAIAVVDPAGDLLAFERMDGVRPASAELAIEKAEPRGGCSGQPRRSRTISIKAGRLSLPPDHVTAGRNADPGQRRGRGRGRYRRQEQGDRHRNRQGSGSGRLRGKAAWLTVSAPGGLKPKA